MRFGFFLALRVKNTATLSNILLEKLARSAIVNRIQPDGGEIDMSAESPDGSQQDGKNWLKKAAIGVVLIGLIVGGLVWLLTPPAEPSYQGKSLSEWLELYDSNEELGPANAQVVESTKAVRAIGTNAIPFLLRNLRASDSALKQKLIVWSWSLPGRRDTFVSSEVQNLRAGKGFLLLGDLAGNAVPDLIQIYAHSPSRTARMYAGWSLMRLYPFPAVSMEYRTSTNLSVGWYIQTGYSSSLMGAGSNAMLAFSQAIKMEPTNSKSYFWRAVCEYQMRDFAATILDIDKAAETSPYNSIFNAFFLRGAAKSAMKDFIGAEADLTKAIDLNSNDAKQYHGQDIISANSRQVSGALDDFSRAIELEPGNTAGYGGQALAEGMLHGYKSDSADVALSIKINRQATSGYIARGLVATALKDCAAARKDFDRAVELSPKNPAAYCCRGAAFLLTDNFDDAAADLDMALRLDPNFYTALANRALLNMKKQNDAGAIADLNRAIELSPQKAEAYGLLGLIQYKGGDWDAALAHCGKALESKPLSGVVDDNSCIWLIRTQRGQRAKADEDLGAYLKSLSDSETNDWSAITARFFLGRTSESNYLNLATTAAKRPSEIKGQVCESLYYAGMMRKLAGDKPGAAQLFQKSVDTKADNNLGYWNSLAELAGPKQP